MIFCYVPLFLECFFLKKWSFFIFLFFRGTIFVLHPSQHMPHTHWVQQLACYFNIQNQGYPNLLQVELTLDLQIRDQKAVFCWVETMLQGLVLTTFPSQILMPSTFSDTVQEWSQVENDRSTWSSFSPGVLVRTSLVNWHTLVSELDRQHKNKQEYVLVALVHGRYAVICKSVFTVSASLCSSRPSSKGTCRLCWIQPCAPGGCQCDWATDG